MEVSATREETVALYYKKQKKAINAFESMPGVCEHNHERCFWEVIKLNHFDDRLWFRHFRMIKSTCEMLCNEIVTKSHEFLLCIKGFIC